MRVMVEHLTTAIETGTGIALSETVADFDAVVYSGLCTPYIVVSTGSLDAGNIFSAALLRLRVVRR